MRQHWYTLPHHVASPGVSEFAVRTTHPGTALVSCRRSYTPDFIVRTTDGTIWIFVFVDQNGFEKHAPKSLAALAASFTEYKG